MADTQKAILANDIKNGTATTLYGLKASDTQFYTPLVREIFDVSGTWVCPSSVNTVEVECWGGGGGGGGRTSSSGGTSGGGGGAYAAARLPVVPATSYTITVATGCGQATGGGTSSFGSSVVAVGGTGGSNNSPTVKAGGAASGCIGEIRMGGGSSQSGTLTSFLQGGAGGAGANLSGGGGFGGRLFQGTADLEVDAATAYSGYQGLPPGGGGGGSIKIVGGQNSVGGSGAAGRVILTYMLAPSEVTTPIIANVENKYTERFDDVGYY